MSHRVVFAALAAAGIPGSVPALPNPGTITCHFPYLLHPRQNSSMLFLLPAHPLNALGSILLREESSSPGMNQDFSRRFRDVGCLHPHKQERWPFPRAPWHEHNFPGRDAKPQEFTLRMSCFLISRSLLTSCDGNGCGRTGKFTDQLCCSCQCSREAVSESSPSLGSTCNLAGSPGSLECCCRMQAQQRGCGCSVQDSIPPRRPHLWTSVRCDWRAAAGAKALG